MGCFGCNKKAVFESIDGRHHATNLFYASFTLYKLRRYKNRQYQKVSHAILWEEKKETFYS